MPAGRPTDYNLDIASRICLAISDGKSLKEICEPEDMPYRQTVYVWLGKHKEFNDMYARAKEDQANSLFDELLAIADDGRNDWMKKNGDDDEGYKLNGEALQRSRLRVDTRKWMASKLLPKQYGDKVTQEVTGADGGAIVTRDESPQSALEIARVLAFALEKGVRAAKDDSGSET